MARRRQQQAPPSSTPVSPCCTSTAVARGGASVDTAIQRIGKQGRRNIQKRGPTQGDIARQQLEQGL
jgi:hypothetical protein